MPPRTLPLATLVCAALCAAPAVRAQEVEAIGISPTIARSHYELRPTAGVTFPLTSDTYSTGWHVGASVHAKPWNWPVALQADVVYHDLGTKSGTAAGADIDSNLLFLGLGAALDFQTATESLRPYLIGGLGVYDGDFGINGGLGLEFAVGGVPAGLFAEVRFHRVFTAGEDLFLMPVTAGARVPL